MFRLQDSPSPKMATIWFQPQMSACWRLQVYDICIYIYNSKNNKKEQKKMKQIQKYLKIIKISLNTSLQ